MASPSSLTYQGRILNTSGQALEYEAVQFQFEITSPDGTCVIYRELSQVKDMRNSNGVFDVPIGVGSKSFPASPVFTLLETFDNAKTFSCAAGGTYTAVDGDKRKLRVQFKDDVGWKLISPDNDIRTVPYAAYASTAQKLGDKTSNDFVLKNSLTTCAANQYLTFDGTNFVCQNDAGASGVITNVTGTSPVSVTMAGSTAQVSVSVGTSAGTVAAGNDGRITGAFQSSTSLGGDLSGTLPNPVVVKIQGHSVSSATPNDGEVLKLNSGVWTPSALAISDVANLQTTLDGKVAKSSLVTCDSSQQTLSYNLVSGTFTCRTIDDNSKLPLAGGTMAGAIEMANNNLTNVGYITMGAGKNLHLSNNTSDPAGLVAADKGKVWFNSTTNEVKYWDGSAIKTLGVAGSGLQSLNGQTGNAQTLASPGTSGSAPNWNSGSDTHTLNIPMASATAVTAGLISKTDYDAFSAKQTSSLSDGKIWMGNGSNVATAVIPSGDVTITNAGVTTVGKLQTKSVVITSLASGELLKYDGTNWVNAALGISDVSGLSTLLSNKIDAGQMPANCASGQTLTFSSPTGSWLCSNISISDSQITYTSKAANTILAAPNGSAGAPTFRTLVATDIPNLDWTKITSGKPTTLSGYGITDSIQNLGGTPSIQTGTLAARPAFGTAGQLYIASDNNTLYRDTGTVWVAIGDGAVGGVTSVTAGAPLSSSGGATPNLTIAQANTTTDGYLSSTDWNTFNNKLGTSTSFSGDVSGTYNATSVDKIKGKSVSPAAYAMGQVLRYDGTSWVNAVINAATDLTGTLAIANGGTGATTTAGVRTNLGLGTAATVDTGSAAGKIPLLGVGGLVANQMCTSDGTASGIICNSTIPTSSQWTTTGSDIYYNTGKVGIGTTAPVTALDVIGTPLTDGANRIVLNLNDATTTVAAGMGAGIAFGGKYNGSTTAGWAGISGIKENATSGDYAGALTFVTRANGSANTERMRITSAGNVGIGTTSPATKLDVSGAVRVGTDATACAAGIAGAIRYNSGNVEYCNGTAWTAFAASGAGITSFNGLTGNTQTFATPGTTGTAPAWSSSGSTHTLNIPMASGAGVTAGLLNKTDYDVFNAKLGTSTAFSGDVSGNYNSTSVDKIKGRTISSTAPTDTQFLVYNNGATQYAPVSMSGDATMSNTGAVTLKNTGTAGTYTKVTTDAQGRVTSGTTLSAADIPNLDWSKITSGKPTTLSGYGVTDAIQNLGGTPSVQTGTLAARPAFGTAGQLYIASDNNTLYRDTGSAWVAIGDGAAGGVTSVTASAPLSSSGGATPNLTIAQANTTTNGYLSSTDWNTFNNKLGTATTFLGDVSGAYNATSVDKIKGKTVSPAAYATGQVLRYDGTNWVNAAVNAATDLTGTLAIANGGTGATTAAAARTNLGLGTSATVDTGSAAGNIPLLGTGGLVGDKMCVANSSGTGIICNSTIPTGSQWTTTGADVYYNSGKVGIGTTAPGSTLDVKGTLRLSGSTSGYVGFTPAAVAGATTYTLPSGDGTNGQVLSTNGAGTLSWATSVTSSTGFVNGGNSFGAAATLGTNDNYNLAFETNNSTRMTIDTSGNVGIGATSPVRALDVRGDAIVYSANGSYSEGSNLVYTGATANGGGFNLHVAAAGTAPSASTMKGSFRVRNGGNNNLWINNYYASTDHTAIEFNNSNNDIWMAPSGGNVGVGSSSPSSKLHVSKTPISSTDYVARVDNNGSVSYATGFLVSNTSGSGHKLVIAAGTAGTSLLASGPLNFATNSNLDLNAPTNIRMTIDASGNVGVGTASPASKLDVSGSVRVGTDATACAAGIAGAIRYNSGNVEYCNGTAWTAFAASGAGLTSLNGLTGNTQTFATPGTTGTAPGWSSSGSAHTLNIPMASASSVTAGLISKTDYDAFNSKLGTATAFSGDVSGTYNATSVDKIKGKTVSPAAYSTGQVLRYDGTNWVNAVINAATDLTGTLAVANGGTGATTAAAARTNLGLGTSATVDTGSAAGNIPLLGTGGLVGDKMCVANSSGTGIICNSTIPTSSQWTTTGSDIYYSTGNVGIGTASPGMLLDLYKASTGTTGVRVKNDDTSAGADIRYILDNATNTAGMQLRSIAHATAPRALNIFNSGTNPITLYTNGAERMRVDSGGNIGIGITSPATKMDVAGSVRVSDDSTTCSSAIAGAIRFSSTTSILETCNGSSWVSSMGAAIPGSSVVVMASCPAGWTDNGSTGSGTGYATCNGTSCRMCQSPTDSSLISASSIMLMENCPLGWSNLGQGVGTAMAGYDGVNFSSCQSPASATSLPMGVRTIMATCPSSWNDLGPTGIGTSLATCGASTCRVCETPGTSYPLHFVGASGGTTNTGLSMMIRGGAGGSTSGGAGGVTIAGGTPIDGGGGSVGITASSGATTTATARNGGSVTISSGSGVSNGNGGSITISAGSGNGTGTNGNILLNSSGVGYVGIGTSTPAAVLDVNGGVRVGSDSSTCDASKKGTTRYNSTDNIMEYCNGTLWSDFNPPGTHCGYYSTLGSTACRGITPSSTCPSGYTRTQILANVSSGDTADYYTCIKN